MVEEESKGAQGKMGGLAISCNLEKWKQNIICTADSG